MFVLLFAFVFGGAIPLPGGGNYREYLMPGIFAQTIVFGAATTAIGMSEDVHKGLIDRFRSLPMARSAVLVGRTLSDVVYNGGILIVLMLSGLVVGWTVRTGFVPLLEGVGLLLLFAFAMSWIGVWLGLSVPSVEVAQQAVFIVLFPITFVSNAFVPVADPAGRAPADRRVESSQHLDGLAPRPVGQSEPVHLDRHPVPAPDPGHPRLDRRHRGCLCPARGPALPFDEPLRAGPRGARRIGARGGILRAVVGRPAVGSIVLRYVKES